MDGRVLDIVSKKIRLFNERSLPGRCRSGTDPVVTDALNRLGIGSNSGLAYLYQHVAGPFASSGGESLPQLLDIVAEDRNIGSFSEKFWQDSDAPRSLLVISEIDTMMGLFYDTKTDGVFEVELDLDWEQFLSGELLPRWTNSVDFLVDFFGEEAIG